MYTFLLPNKQPINQDEVIDVLGDSEQIDTFVIDLQTGKVEKILPSATKVSDSQILIKPISFRKQRTWLQEFTTELLSIEDQVLTKRVLLALENKNTKLAIQTAKTLLETAGNNWINAWQQWKQDCLWEELCIFIGQLPVQVETKLDLPDNCELCRKLKAGYI